MANFGKKASGQPAPAFGRKDTMPRRRYTDGSGVPQATELSEEALAFLTNERAGRRNQDVPAEPSSRPAYEIPAGQAGGGSIKAGKPVAGLRILSYLLDTLVVTVPFFIIMWPSLIAPLETLTVAPEGSVAAAKANLKLLEIFAWHALARCIYAVSLEATKQATFGKMAVGIVVTNKHGDRPSLFTVIMRNTIGRAALNFIPLCMGYFMILFDKNKKGPHDMISGSMVCKKDSAGAMSTAEVFA